MCRRLVGRAPPRAGFASRRRQPFLRRLLRRRQGDRAGIVAAGGLDQRLDAALDRRVRREQVRKSLARIVEAHLHHRGGGAGQLAAALDLAQRRDHGVGILGELDRAGIGEKLARARQREADQQRENPRDRDQRDRDEDREAVAAAAAILAARSPRAEADAAVEPQPEEQLGEERDGAGDDDGDHHHAHVAVADVRELVAEHRLELRIVETVQQPGRHRDGVLLLVHAGGEGVERVGLDDLELRHRNAAGDAEVLEQIIEARLLGPSDVVAAGHRVDHRLMEIVGDDDPGDGAGGRPRRRVKEIEPRLAQQIIERSVVRQRFGDERAGIDHEVDRGEQADQQDHRLALVRLDMAVEPVGRHWVTVVMFSLLEKGRSQYFARPV